MWPVQEGPSRSIEGVVATMLLDAAAAEVTRALGRNELPSRLLKGAALGAWLYDGAERTYVDVDLLVSPRDLERVEEVLRQLDFSPAGVGVDAQEAWDVLAPRVDRTVVEGENVEILDEPARALHVVLHAAQHGARSPQALADLERALGRVPLETWRQSEALARRLDALPAFVLGLSLTTEGEALVAQLGLGRVSNVEAELRVGTAREETLGSALGFEWLRGAPNPPPPALVFRSSSGAAPP